LAVHYSVKLDKPLALWPAPRIENGTWGAAGCGYDHASAAGQILSRLDSGRASRCFLVSLQEKKSWVLRAKHSRPQVASMAGWT